MFPVPNIRSAKIQEADTLEHELCDWQIESVQLTPGEFQLVTDRIVFADLVVERSRHNLAKKDDYRLPPNTTSLCLFKPGARPGHWCGNEIPEDSILVNQSDTDHFAVLPDGYEHITILISNELLSFWDLLPRHLNDADGTSQKSIIPLLGAFNSLFRDWLYSLFDKECQERLASSPNIENKFREQLHSGMMRLIDEGRALQGDRVRTRRPATHYGIVRRACELIGDRIEENLTTTVMASELSVNVRSLQRAFIDVVGITPSQYVQVAKLRSVRQILRDNGCTKTTVSQVAIQHGFTELGRFSVRYRKMFGESPSRTLRNGPRVFAVDSTGNRKLLN